MRNWTLGVALALTVTAVSPALADFKELRARLDQRLLEQLRASNAAAADAWAAATAADNAGDRVTARWNYQRVSELVPDFSPAVRRRCSLDAQEGKRAAALSLCREAVQLEASGDNLAALAHTLVLEEGETTAPPADVEEAHELAERAARIDPDDPTFQFTRCNVELKRNDGRALADCASRLVRLAPDSAGGHFVMGISHAQRGEMDEAVASIERARKLGMDAKTCDSVLARIEEARPWYEVWGGLILKVFAAWLVAGLALFVLGLLLSAAAMRSVQRLPAEATGRAQGLDAHIRRANKAVLWACCAYYYASMPLIVALVLGGGGAVLYAFVALGRIPIKLIAIVVIVALATAWAVVKSLFVRVRDEDPGTRVGLGGEPALRRVLYEVAAKIGTRPVNNVYLTPATDMAVTERRSSMFKQLLGVTSERCLILGAGLLDGMKVIEFRSILGHEYGHFQNRDTAGGGFALAVRRSLITLAIGLAQAGVASWYNPAWLFVNGFFKLFLRISHGASRLQEILCDRWAAFAYGSAAFERGLRHVVERSVVFDAHASATLDEVVKSGAPLRNLYAYAPAQPIDRDAIASSVEEQINAAGTPYDSHPPPAERIALVRRLNAPGSQAPDDEQPAWSLFADRAAIERMMTEVVRGNLAENHGVVLRDDPDRPDAASE